MVFCLNVYLYSMCMPSSPRGQKRVSGPLELEFQLVVNCLVGFRNQIQVPYKSIQCS